MRTTDRQFASLGRRVGFSHGEKNSTAALFLRLQGRANGWVLRLVITGSSLSPAGTTDVQRRKTTAAARGDHQPINPGRTGARPASALTLLTASRLIIARSTRLADASRRTLPHQWSSRPTAHVQTLGRPSGTKSRHNGLTARVLGLMRRPAPFGCRRYCNTNTSKITDFWRFTSGLSVSRPTDPGCAGIPDGKQKANTLNMPCRKGIAAVQSTPLLRHHPCFLRCQLTITAAYPASRRNIPMRTTPISTWA